MKFHNQPQTRLFGKLVAQIRELYGENLVSLVLYGSYARGDARLNSDIDILVVLGQKGTRCHEFEAFYDTVEKSLEKDLNELEEKYGIAMEISPLILSKEGAGYFNPLYFDMLEASEILLDKDGFFQDILKRASRQKAKHHFRKIQEGNNHIWDFGNNSFAGARI